MGKKFTIWSDLNRSMRIFHFLRPQKLIFILGFIFLLLSSFTALVFPSLMGDLLDAQNLPQSRQDEWFNSGDIDTIALLLLLVFLAQAVFSYFRIYLFSMVTENMLANLRQTMYEHLIRLPMSFFSSVRVGELNSRIASDISLLQETFTTTIAEFVRQFITILVGVALISIYSWQLTLLMLGTIPVIAIIAVIFGRFIRKLSKNAQQKLADSNVVVEETFSSITSVKAFANELFEIARYRKLTGEVRDISLLGAKWRAAFVSFIIFAVFGAIVLIIWKAANLKEEGILTIGELIKFILYTVFIGASFAGLPELYAKIQKAIGATENLLELLEKKTESLHLIKPGNATHLKGEIDFKNVNFNYPSREETTVLKDITFHANAGEQIAIVGASGAGKSTLANLLLRFYDVNSGEILIDGKNVEQYDLTTLRNHMAIVPQEILLFGGSIAENIAYGKPGSSMEEIRAAAEKANASEFIERFPKQYEELVGDRGIQLSGGQRQRIAIARVFLKDPSVLILDEATSSLDSEGEQLVQEALEKLMTGRTSFVIAHRLSTIKGADRILVLDRGELKESGEHEQLMKQENGIYKKLITLQYSS